MYRNKIDTTSNQSSCPPIKERRTVTSDQKRSRFTSISVEQQDDLLESLQKKVILYYPKNFTNEPTGFKPFRQLKAQNIVSLARDFQKIRLKTEESVNPEAAQVLCEVRHNNLMRKEYQQMMGYMNMSTIRNLEALRNKQINSRSPSRKTSANRGPYQSQSFQQQLAASEKELFLQKTEVKHYFTGHVSKVKPHKDYIYCNPESREGAKLLKQQYKGILLGGYSHREHSLIYQMDLNNYSWHRSSQQKAIGCSFSAVTYQNDIYILGGERRVNGGRMTTNELWKYSKGQWEQIFYGGDYLEPRKNFTMLMGSKGRHLVVIGGVGGDYKFFKDIHVIDLTMNKNKCISEDMGPNFENGLAYHGCFGSNPDQGGPEVKCFPDFKKPLNKPQWGKNGIYLWGGKDFAGTSYQRLYYFDSCELPTQIEIIQTKGKHPSSRHSFSLNQCVSGNVVAIFGGTDDERIFNDLHVIFLNTLTWHQVRLTGDFISHRYDHVSLMEENKLIILGGVCTEGFKTCEPYMIELEARIFNDKKKS